MTATTSNFGTRGQFHVIDDTTHQTAVAHDKHRKAARVLIAQAIDTTSPEDLPATAREVRQILGLIPSPPPARPARQRGEPGWNHPSRKATK